MKVNFWEALAAIGFLEAEIGGIKEQLKTAKPGDNITVVIPGTTTVDHHRLANVTLTATVE